MATQPRHQRALEVDDLSAPRVLLVSPEPFFEERGTPIAILQVVKALSHAGYAVDQLSYPV